MPQEIPRCSYLQSQFEARPREQHLAVRPKTAAGKRRRLPSEELDASAIIQRDNFSLVLLLQGLQGTEQRSLIQAMKLYGRTIGKKIASGNKQGCEVQGMEAAMLRALKSSITLQQIQSHGYTDRLIISASGTEPRGHQTAGMSHSSL